MLTTNNGRDGFPDGFLTGFAISTFQNSGDPNSQWGHFEQRTHPGGQPTICNGQKCGVAGDFWNKYETKIRAAAELGSTVFRLSLEWARIEPQQGVISQEAVERFRDMLHCIRRNGMEPIVTIHHFVHPEWFERLGGFETQANLSHFFDYVELVAREYGDLVTLWLTFNEPNVYTFFGYIMGDFPPAKKNNLWLAGRVLGNLLMAHCIAYYKIKATPGCQHSKVGLVHNIMRFEARNDGISNRLPYVRIVAGIFDHMWTVAQLEFMQTGVFHWRPLGSWLFPEKAVWPGGKPPMDWVGLNIYSRIVGDYLFRVDRGDPGEVMTDMDYALHPQCVGKAVELLSSLKVPIYITEVGVADERDAIRSQMIETYMPEVADCIRRGYDLRGLCWWTFENNFEWSHGFSKCFGVYSMDRNGVGEMYRGAKGLFTWWQKLRETYNSFHKAGSQASQVSKTAVKAPPESPLKVGA